MTILQKNRNTKTYKMIKIQAIWNCGKINGGSEKILAVNIFIILRF